MRTVFAPALVAILLVAPPSPEALPSPSPAGSPPAIELLAAGPSGMSLRFELPELVTETVPVEGQAFELVSIPGGAFTGEVGEPAVPVVTRLVAIPDDCEVAATAVPLETEVRAGVHLLPVQEGDGARFAYRAGAYARDAAGDGPQVEVGPPQILRDLRVVGLTFRPVQYDPAAGTLTVTRTMRVDLTFAPAPGGSPRPVRRATIAPSFDRLYRELVINYQGPPAGVTVAPGSYLVICPDDPAVTSRLQPLLDWRQRTGVPVVLATTAQTGATNGQIKSYILNALLNWPDPPEYVVLAGDAAAPYAIPTWYESLSGYNGEGDHPYTELTGGDILADVHLGRLSYSSLDELARIVAKTVGYEKTPYMSETSWFTRGVVVGDPASSGYSVIDAQRWLKTRLLALGYTEVDTVFTSPFVSQMSGALNRGDTIFTYRGWLGMSGWSNANTYALVNGWKMPFAAILTCDTGSFAAGTSRTEGFLRAGTGTDQPKGAIGAIGTATTGTHTRYNNCMHYGIFHGLLRAGQSTMGAALTRGKMELYLNYYAADPSHAEIYAHWNNLMGDPAVEVWTAVPAGLEVSHPASLPVGANSVAVTVTSGGAPVEGARVCLWKGQETFVAGATDALGEVELAITPATAGDLLLTATKRNCEPGLATIPVAAASVYVGHAATVIDDAAGNGDGQPNPGETLGLRVEVENFGSAPAPGVTGTLTTADPYVSLIDAEETFGDIPGGATAWTLDDFDLDLAPGCPDGHVARLDLALASGAGQWRSVIELAVKSADLFSPGVTVWDGGNSRLDPGETADLSVKLRNDGAAPAGAVSGTLVSLSPFVTVSDSSGTFGTIPAGGSGENAADRFTVSASASTYGGYLASFSLFTEFSGGGRDTTLVTLVVGARASTDPVGPDGHGYLAFDDTDAAYPEAPAYGWIEIDPAYGGDGTEVVLGDFGEYQDRSAIVALPFPFKYYGQSYAQATICSNGWIAMGSTYLITYRNWTIPGAGGPDAMLAVFWDDLYQVTGARVCQKYDAANHRWIVEWSRLRNAYDGATEVFEAILYDPAHHGTDTGDGIIVYQYNTVVNSDGVDGYATVGIESPDQEDGVLVTFFNRYSAGAAPLAAGRAIRFVPIAEGPVGTLEGETRNAYNDAPIPGVQVTVLGTGRSFASASNGHYSGAVPPGTYAVAAGHPSFAPDTAFAVAIQQAGVTRLDFALTDIAPPAITTTRHPHTADPIGPYPIPVRIVEYSGLAERTLHYRTNGGSFTALPLAPAGGDDYLAQIPGQPYTTWVEYYVRAVDGIGLAATDPPDAPSTLFAFAVAPMQVLLDDPFEAAGGWTIGAPDDNATTGIWVREEPVGTLENGLPVQPEDDHTPDPGQICYVTGNAGAGEPAGTNDVDGGKTTLISPVFDLDGYDTASVTYWVWYSNDRGNSPGEDVWAVDVTNDGLAWASLESTNLSTNAWVERAFTLDSRVSLTDRVQLRFVASDFGAGSLVEAAVDDFVLRAMRVTTGMDAQAMARRNGLDPCRPNPLRSGGALRYRVASAGTVRLRIYDVAGRLVRTLVDGPVAAGEHALVWDGRGTGGARVASGIYFLRLEAPGYLEVRQVAVLR